MYQVGNFVEMKKPHARTIKSSLEVKISASILVYLKETILIQIA